VNKYLFPVWFGLVGWQISRIRISATGPVAVCPPLGPSARCGSSHLQSPPPPAY
jgi:hypothetical protein